MEIGFKLRHSELTTEEKLLLDKEGVNEKYFKSLFSEIVISEIKKNSFLKNRVERNGIIFYGINIDINKYLQLKQELEKTNLEIEISLNTPSERWNDFRFPFYPNRNTVIDINKQVYKIYKSTDNVDFIDQIDYVYHDKENVRNVYEDWKLKYNVVPIGQTIQIIFC